MYSLLIDTSNTQLAVGLAKEHQLIDKSEYEAWQRQSELLVAEIDKLMTKNNVSRQDIGEVIACKGPGSYTGVRIALTVAKVTAFALQVPLFLVSSLEAQKDVNKPTICLMNARSKRSYIGVYDGDKALLKDCVMENSDVLTYINSHPDDVVSGDTAYLGVKGVSIDPILNLMQGDVAKNKVADVLSAKPVYLKDGI